MKIEECRNCGLTKYGSMLDGICSDCWKDKDQTICGKTEWNVENIYRRRKTWMGMAS